MAENQAEDKKTENTEAEGSEDKAESGKKKSNFLVIAILLFVVILASVGGYVLISSGAEKKEEKKEIKEEVIVPSVFFEVPEIIVSLSGNTSNIRYLKLVLSLELASAEDQASLEALMPKVIDEYQTYLRQLRLEDLRGSIGTYRLKEALLLRVNQIIQPVQTKDVLIKEMLIQ